MAVEKAISYDQARKKINKAAPKGHQLAFITPAEAKMLKDKGGSGEMTEAGIKSYRGHTGGHEGKGGGSSSGSGSGSGSGQGGNQGRSRRGTTTTSKAVRDRVAQNKAAQSASRRQQGQISSKKTTKKTTKKSFSEKLAEKRAKNEAQRAQVEANQAAARAQNEFNRATGFMTKKGFLRDKFGNIVRSKTQVDRFNEKKEREKALRDMFASQIQAQEAKQVTPTFSGLKGFLDRTRKRLGTGEFSIEKANQLKDINRALGDFDYTGMSIGNQLRAQAGDLAAGIPGLAKIGSALAGGPLGIAGLIASGGKGIAGLIADRLGIGEDDEQQVAENPNLREGTMATQQPGFLSGIASALRLGEGPGFTEERGGGRQQPIIPPPTTGGLFGRVPGKIKKAIPITTQPVDNRMLNQYLALAGFTPQEIQGMPESFRFLS